MKARLAVIGAALAVAATLAVVWLGSGRSPFAHAPSEPPPESQQVGASPGAVVRRVERRVDGETDAAVEREPLAAVVVDDVATPGKNLRIVDEHGAPVPGAEYFEGPWPYHSYGGLSVQAAMQELWRPDVWLTTKCTRQIADADGWVQCRPSDTPWLGVARHGDRQGRGIRWGEPNELPLLPPKPCRVVVVGASGAPIEGASVIVRLDDYGDHDVIVGVTDAAGECLAADLDWLARDRWLGSPLSTWRFGVRGLGLRASEVPFDVADPPGQVRLQLPPCGMVAIEVRGPDGARTASAEPVVLGTDHEELLDAYEFVEEYAQASGPVDVGLVACDAQLVASNCRLYDGVPNGTRRFRGPSVDGERIVLTLDPLSLRPGGRMLTGRVVFEDSRPAANVTIRVRGADRSRFEVTTNDAGRFFLTVDKEDLEFLSAGSLQVVQIAGRGADRPRRAARCAVPDLRHAELGDVGDVVLLEPRLLVRGVVRRGGAIDRPAIESIRTDVAGARVTWNERGEFEVHGATRRAKVRIDVAAEGCRGEERWVAVGSLDYVVEVEDAVADGAVLIRVLVDAGVLGRGLSDRLRFELVGDAALLGRDGTIEEEGAWLSALTAPAGIYELRVLSFLDVSPIAVERSLVVRSGERAEVVVDLRGRLRSMRVEWSAVGGDRDRPRDATVIANAVRTEGGQRWRDVLEVADDHCVLLGVAGPVDLSVVTDVGVGHYRGPLADCAITLEPIVEVPFEVPDLPAAPPDAEWTVRLVSTGGEADIGWRSETDTESSDAGFLLCDVGANGRGTIPIATNTTYEVELLFCPDESVRPFVALPAIPPELVVGDALPEKLVFRFAPEAMQSAAR